MRKVRLTRSTQEQELLEVLRFPSKSNAILN